MTITQKKLISRIENEKLTLVIIDAPAICGGLSARIEETRERINIRTAEAVAQNLRLISKEPASGHCTEIRYQKCRN